MRRTRKCLHTQQTTLGKRNTEYRESIAFSVLNLPLICKKSLSLERLCLSLQDASNREAPLLCFQCCFCAHSLFSVHIVLKVFKSPLRLTDRGWYPTESKPYADSLIPALAEKRADACNWCFFWLDDTQVLYSVTSKFSLALSFRKMYSLLMFLFSQWLSLLY